MRWQTPVSPVSSLVKASFMLVSNEAHVMLSTRLKCHLIVSGCPFSSFVTNFGLKLCQGQILKSHLIFSFTFYPAQESQAVNMVLFVKSFVFLSEIKRLCQRGANTNAILPPVIEVLGQISPTANPVTYPDSGTRTMNSLYRHQVI